MATGITKLHGLRSTPRDARTLGDALTEFVAGMAAGTTRPKGRERYKPNTCAPTSER